MKRSIHYGKVFFLFAVVVVLVTGCNLIDDAASIDIEANDVRFNFEAVTGEGGARSVVARAAGDTGNTFSVTRTVKLEEISADVANNAERISKVIVNSSGLVITTSPSLSYKVSNLKLSAKGVSGSLSVPSYTVGGAFTAPSNMATYTATLVMKLVDNGSVEVTISGETDAPAGTTIYIKYENDLVFTAKLL